MEKRICPICGDTIHGRIDKIYCSVKCKSIYHRKIHEVTQPMMLKTNRILKRNYTILFELMQGRIKQKKIPRINLDRHGFNYRYYTGSHINSKGKTYYHVYDYSWMEFSDQEIYIVKRSKS